MQLKHIQQYTANPADANPNVAPLAATGAGVFAAGNNFRFGFDDNTTNGVQCSYVVYALDMTVNQQGGDSGVWWSVASGAGLARRTLVEFSFAARARARSDSHLFKVALTRTGGDAMVSNTLDLYRVDLD